MNDEVTYSAGVSYAKTPLDEIAAKHAAITELGWREDRRGDPWVVSYRKVFPWGEERNAVPELSAVMGDYWVSADEIELLLASAS